MPLCHALICLSAVLACQAPSTTTGGAGSSSGGAGSLSSSAVGTTSSGASSAGNSSSGVTTVSSSRAGIPDGGPAVGNVRFFGFAAVDCGYDDPLDTSTITNYLDEVSGFTNTAHVCVASPTDDLHARLTRAAAAGVRGLLDINALVFHSVAGASSANPALRLALRSDAASRLASFFTLNATVLDAQHVLALYVADEPAWNGMTMADLQAGVDLVRAKSTLPIALVEAGAALGHLVVPAAVDLLGADRYDTADPEMDATWRADVTTLLALRSRPEQRLLLVMDTQWRTYYGAAGIQPEGMAFVAQSTLRVAVQTPEVVGVLGYLWPGGFDLPDQKGARELPESVQAVYRDIGHAVMAHVP